MEWFTSRTLRESVAIEQREAVPEAPPLSCTETDAVASTTRSPAILHAHGGMKTDVIGDQSVLVKRTPYLVLPEVGSCDRPRTIG
ncbi:hypothetical protein [Streptomyces viridochromogenes]|uniref:hypothetical protein n=1 Tax=Streptomyces viridochromogenes TaxID=1938 RepID=UPI001319CD3E|nr:hypothetical protein [Streptomyces viridochromogenes]